MARQIIPNYFHAHLFAITSAITVAVVIAKYLAVWQGSITIVGEEFFWTMIRLVSQSRIYAMENTQSNIGHLEANVKKTCHGENHLQNALKISELAKNMQLYIDTLETILVAEKGYEKISYRYTLPLSKVEKSLNKQLYIGKLSDQIASFKSQIKELVNDKDLTPTLENYNFALDSLIKTGNFKQLPLISLIFTLRQTQLAIVNWEKTSIESLYGRTGSRFCGFPPTLVPDIIPKQTHIYIGDTFSMQVRSRQPLFNSPRPLVIIEGKPYPIDSHANVFYRTQTTTLGKHSIQGSITHRRMACDSLTESVYPFSIRYQVIEKLCAQ